MDEQVAVSEVEASVMACRTSPTSPAKLAIAASIVYVAIENFFSRNVDSRWRDTFAFGLVHGFGFASALQEFGLPRGAVVPALAAFNIGVEVGQVAIVSLVIPLLIGVDWLIARMRGAPQDRTAALVYAFSGIIASEARPGLVWTSAKGAYAQPVAEHALVLTLALMRVIPKRVRATGLSVVYSVGVSIFGGFAQFIVTWLIRATGNPMSPAWYVVACSAISLCALLALRERGAASPVTIHSGQ